MADRDWFGIDVIAEQFELAQKHVATAAASNFYDLAHGLLPSRRHANIESPLEAIFWLWWTAFGFSHQIDERFALVCQHEIVCSNDQRYRLDFFIKLRDEAIALGFADAGAPFPLVAVEVDGHAFHEKTPEQVAKRNSRDRALQQDKWIVFHFSWSELTKTPAARVGELVDFLDMQWNDCSAAEGQKWTRENPEKVAAILKRIEEGRKGAE